MSRDVMIKLLELHFGWRGLGPSRRVRVLRIRGKFYEPTMVSYYKVLVDSILLIQLRYLYYCSGRFRDIPVTSTWYENTSLEV